MISIDEINRLKAENDKLKECNAELTSDNLNTIQEMDNERRRVEQLKEENERLNDIIDSYQPRLEELKELKAENETLKITREKLLGDLCITEESLKDYEEHYKRSEQQKEKYYQTLQEIKEFCKKEIEYFDNNDNYGQQADWIALLQKITKAEEE